MIPQNQVFEKFKGVYDKKSTQMCRLRFQERRFSISTPPVMREGVGGLVEFGKLL